MKTHSESPTILEKKRFLVTGGAGFIGSWFVRHLLSQYPTSTITNLDLLTYAGNLDNLKDIETNPQYRFVQGDIRDAALVSSLMKDTDICVNFAAQTHVDRSITGPSEFISTNVLGAHTLIDAAYRAGIEKFVQVSTDEVYGSLGPTGLFTETSPLEPSSPYSASKASGDLICLSYFKTFGFPVCITRCSNNYGPYQYPEKMIPLFILNAMNHLSLPVYGDGLNVRDWIYVEDHNRAVARVVQSGRPGEVYNIGASSEKNNLEMTRTILRLTERPESLMKFVPDRLGHDRRYAIDSSKIQTELGWSPQKDFEAGIQETIEWYRSHLDWIEGVLQKQRLENDSFAQEQLKQAALASQGKGFGAHGLS
ncbi:MAG: dTDP-glucose 4,6-dehydratase [Cyanobacteria bacterium]|nr:dTDP-glucose 4,6-dehydratase [Cyanobacteriota bacterium]